MQLPHAFLISKFTPDEGTVSETTKVIRAYQIRGRSAKLG